ncbi:unnamed protein product [Effrenium voratum]|uniref:Carrier domain-containing protein n=1 Tax=Effrenium voratum TaxID=2562239 RepID=A0AA36JN87_9DINO|nr:unnamed protein product [Effrenium voratum]
MAQERNNFKGADHELLLSRAEAAVGGDDRTKEDAIRAAEQVRRSSSGYMKARALLALAALRMDRGEDSFTADLELGLQHAREARELAKELKDPRLEARCLVAMIDGEGWLTSPDDAMQVADEALDLCLDVQDRAMEADTLCRMAEWNVKLGDHSRAVSDLEDSLEIYEQLESPQELRVLQRLLRLLQNLDVRQAKRRAEAALRKQSDKLARIDATKMLVEVLLKMGSLQEAVSASVDGINLCKELGRPAAQAGLMIQVSRGRLQAGDAKKAVAVGEEAWRILQKITGPNDDKVQAMQLLCDAKLSLGEEQEALEYAEDFRDHFESVQDAGGLAKASLLCAQLQLQQDLDSALDLALRAADACRKGRRRREEAAAVKLCSEVLWKKAEHKAAMAQAEKARALFRDLEDMEEEIACCYLAAENAVRLAAQEGARAKSNEPAPREARVALEKSLKAAEAGLKMTRIASLMRAPELHGQLLCAKAQALTVQGRFEAALTCLDEAVLRFRELGDYQLEANGLMLASDNLRFLKRLPEAVEALEEGLLLYQHCSDEEGEQRAQEMLKQLRAPTARPQPAPDAKPEVAPGIPVWQQAAEVVPEAAATAVRPSLPSGPALDMARVTPELVMAKVREVAAAVTGTENDEIHLETPLMEAGMTSQAAVMMRDQLSKDLPGIRLPATLVFDYPSITEMSEMIVVATNAQAIKASPPGRRRWKSDLPDLGDLDRIGLDSSDEEDEKSDHW